jgi:hypothetical protein
MEKYGYKNISSRSEFEKASNNDGKFNVITPETENITNYGFVDWSTQGDFGMPGQTKYNVKSIDDLINAGTNVSK